MSEQGSILKEDAVRDVSPVYLVGAETASTEDVPPGYKRTEVGVIPKDWQVKRLGCTMGNIIDFRGRTPRKLGMTWGGGDIPALSARNVKMGKIDFSEETYYGSEKLYKRWMTNGHAKKDDVAVTMEAPLGNVALIPDSQKYILSQRTILLQPDSNSLLSEFLLQLLSSYWFQRALQDNGTGSTATGIQRRRFEQLDIPCPRITEQHAIATALSDADALIESLDRLIAKKRAIKQAAMQQLLTGQTRLPGFTGEWETKRLGDVAEIEMGQSPSSKFYNTNGEGIPLIQGNADIVDRHTIRRIFTTQVTKRGQSGDVLLSVRAPVGEVSRTTFDVCLGRGVCALQFPNDFLFHYLVFIEPTWARHSKGSTFDSVSSADIRALEIELPGAEEQIAIATVLSDMDTEIKALEHRRDKARQIKQGMMQQLLTGRVRLVTPGAAA